MDLVPMLIAGYGAVLATITAVRGRQRNQKSMTVTCSFGYQQPQPGANDAKAVPIITIQATNTGVRPIEVSGAGFVSAVDGEHVESPAYAIDPTPTPTHLADGASIRLHYSTTEEETGGPTIEVAQVYVRTTPDGVWFGEPDEWRRPLLMRRRWWGGDPPLRH